MADFVQTMKDWRRMCNACQTEKDIHGVCGCYPAGNYAACAMKSMDKEADLACDNLYFERLEKTITAFAAEHPEPVYPTWTEWLYEMGLILKPSGADQNTSFLMHMGIKLNNVLSPKADTPIPADIAQKLGIEPKEDA